LIVVVLANYFSKTRMNKGGTPMKNYLKQTLSGNGETPQSVPLTDEQVRNNAGGFVWEISQWEQLKRFLVLGSEGGSYYVSERALTLENTHNIQQCIQADGQRVVNEIIAISEDGRAPKNDPAIFALALCTIQGDEATRKVALAALPKVCRTATHLFMFIEFIKDKRGWGRMLRREIGNWYTEKSPSNMAYQIVKYRNRNGWTHTDVLRKAHPKPPTTTHDQIMQWVTHADKATWTAESTPPTDEALRFIWAFEKVQASKDVQEVIQLITDYRLPREALPTEWLNHAVVWDALLQDMPMTAMIRNLGVMSKVELLKPLSQAESLIVQRLVNATLVQKARIHPIAALLAQATYAQGRGMRGSNTWTVSPTVVDALETTFELAFKNVTPSNKRTMLALDVSGSMSGGSVAGAPLTPRDASGAMAMISARTEPQVMFTAFQSQMVDLAITPKMRLPEVIKTISNLPFGGTDCALPMLYALQNKLEVDTFVVYTDSETWAGGIHPSQALKDYREKTGIEARLVVVGMVSNNFTIADPKDKGMLDVVGFDASAPALIADFSRGDL
jgi:60 kDa SS-A/Ro ribonucleoprotein